MNYSEKDLKPYSAVSPLQKKKTKKGYVSVQSLLFPSVICSAILMGFGEISLGEDHVYDTLSRMNF